MWSTQLRANLRWVTSGEFRIKASVGIKLLSKLGLRISVSISNLEIDFPVWIQAHLQEDLKAAVKKVQIAATDDPKIRVALSLGFFSTKSFPGMAQLLELGIRKAVKKVLVLPKKFTKYIG